LVDVPLSQCRQALSQGIDGKRIRVVHEVLGDTIRCGRQEAAPFDLKMLNCCTIAATRVIACSGLDVLFDCAMDSLVTGEKGGFLDITLKTGQF